MFLVKILTSENKILTCEMMHYFCAHSAIKGTLVLHSAVWHR